MKIRQKLLLILLVLLPAAIPFGCCEYYLLPEVFSVGENGIDTETIAFMTILFSVVVIPYWTMVGVLAGRWLGIFRKAFFLCNLPIFFNGVAELIYFGALGRKQGTNPILEFIIGSHLDKFNVKWNLWGGFYEALPSMLQSIEAVILIDMAIFLGFFALGCSITCIPKKILPKKFSVREEV